ncbi:MAG: hypothetical protein FWB90_07005 [Fibromonadales bacterium]|nr:hypothetical protein [Fibromonadales bacterium]
MKTNRLPLLLASLSFAVAFIASCSMEDDDVNTTTSEALSFYEYDPESSSSIRPSSSSSIPDAIGGEFTEPFTLVFDQNTAIMTMSGTIAATNNNMISEVVINDNYLISELKPYLTLPAPTVSLDGITSLNLQCNMSYRFSITATFDNGQSLSMVKIVPIECNIVPTLHTYDFTLSSTFSYADLDYEDTYAYFNYGIDLIAYSDLDGDEGNKIYAPWYFDEFWSNDYSEYYGSDVMLWELPPGAAAILQNANSYSDLEQFEPMLDAILDGPDVEEINIAPNKAFLVFSSEWDLFAVVITDVGMQTATFKAILLD